MIGLEGVKVLELGGMVSAAYATKLMADLGADVVKIEEPGGDPMRYRGPFPKGIPDPEKSGTFLYLNTNKRGAAIDLAADRAALADAAGWADILVHNYPPARMAEIGIDYAALSARNPRLVMCSITPFGLTGPYKDYRAYELTITNAGGWAWLSPGASEYPELPPLKAHGHQAEFQAGVAAAMTSMAAHYRAIRTGQGEHIDLSAREYVASILEQNFVYYTYCGAVASRLGRRLLHPWGQYTCKDGNIFLLIGEDAQWNRLVELMGNPEWARWDIFKDGLLRSENSDVLKMYINEWAQNWTVVDLFRAGQENRICFAPVSAMADLADDPHLRARGFLVGVDHPKAGTVAHPGAPYKFEGDWWKIRRPAPTLGQHTSEALADFGRARETAGSAAAAKTSADSESTQLPLEGIRVLDFSWVWAGPMCAMQLAHLGAEVIKVESRERPDMGRRLPIYPNGMKGGLNQCGYFNQWNQGKKSIELNLGNPGAVKIAKALAAKVDVIVDNFATGVMEGLGLGHEELHKLNPNLVIASIAGYGHTGPRKNYMGYGPAIVAISGLASQTGYPGGGAQEVGISLGDPNGGIHAAAAICAAVAARQRNGGGQYIDVSLWESMSALIAEGWMEYAMNRHEPERIGNRDEWMAPHNCFRCAGEDEWVSIACGSEDEWRALSRVIGRPELAESERFRTLEARKANEAELETIVSAWTISRSKWDVTRDLQAAGVAAFPSMNSRDIAEDRHLKERGFFSRMPHPEIGVQTHIGIPWRLAHGVNGVRSAAPILGHDTDAVLREILGYSDSELARLREEGALSK